MRPSFAFPVKPMMKKIARFGMLFIVGVLGLAAFIFFGTVTFISLPRGEKYVRNLALPRLETFFDQRVRIGGFETDVFSRARLTDVLVYRENPDGSVTPLLRFKRATVRYGLGGLLRRKFTVRSVRIEDVSFNIEVDSTGKSNLPNFGRGGPPGKPGPIQFSLATVSVENAVFRYTNRKIPLRTTLQGITASLTSKEGGGFRFGVDADSIRFFYHGGMLAGSGVTGKGNLNGSTVLVNALKLHLPASTLNAADFTYQSDPKTNMSGIFTLTGRPEYVVGFLRAAFSPSIPTLDGDVVLRAALSQPGGDIRVAYSLVSPHLVVGRIPTAEPLVADDALITGAWEHGVARVDTLTLRTLGGTVRGRGALSPSDMTARDTLVEFNRLSAARLRRLLGISDAGYSGTLTGWAEANGVVTDPARLTATLSLRILNPAYGSRTVPDVAGHAALNRGLLRAEITSLSSMITASANVGTSRLSGVFSVRIGELADFAPVFGVTDLSGNFSARGTLGGRFSAPDVRANVYSDSLNYANLLVNYLNGGVAYQAGELTLANLGVLGRVDSLSALYSPLRVDSLSGSLTYAARLDGPLTAIRGEAEILAKPLAYRNINLDSALVHAFVRADTVHVDRMLVENDSLRIDGSGMFNYATRSGRAGIDFRRKLAVGEPETGGLLFLTFDAHDPNALTAVVRGDDISLPFFGIVAPGLYAVDGTLFFTGKFDGPLENPKATLVFEVRKPAYKTTYLDSIGGNILLRDGVVALDSLRLYRDGFYSAAAGSLRLIKTPSFYTASGNSAIQLAARGDGFQLGWVKEMIPGIEGISGVTSYDFALGGTLGDPVPVGTAAVRGFSMSPGGGAPSIRNTNVDAAFERDVVTLSMTDGTILEQPFTLDALVAYKPPGYGGDIAFFLGGDKVLTVNGTVNREQIQATALVDSFNLAILGAFVPTIGSISGTMNANLTVTGTIKNPRPNGTVNLRNLAMNIPGVDVPLRDGIADITVSPDRIVVDTLFVWSRNGTIQADGAIENLLTPPVSGAINARVSKVLVRKEKLFNSQVNDARLTFSGRGNAYLLSGRVTLGETRFLQNFTVQDLVRRITRPSAPTGETPSFMRRTRLNVLVNADETLYIDNNLADIQLRADLEVIGTLASPLPIGRIVAVKGNILYLDRKFAITEGTLDFTDRTQINPQIDIEAETTVSSLQVAGNKSYTVTLTMTGTLRSPAVSLVSNPPLDRPNILSLLTLGVTREQVGIGAAPSDTTTSIESVLTQRAELLASQQISGYLGGRLGNLLGLGSVVVEGNLFDLNSEQQGPRIVASKRLNERVEITYSTAIRDLTDQGFRVNYDVSNTVSLQGETDSTGRTGLDLLYRFRFQ